MYCIAFSEDVYAWCLNILYTLANSQISGSQWELHLICCSISNSLLNWAWGYGIIMLCTFLTIHHIKSSFSACRLPPWRSFLKCSPCQIWTKRLARVNLEQTRKSSLLACGTSVVPISHLEFMSSRSLPCYVGMRVLPLAQAVIMSSTEGFLRSPMRWRWAQSIQEPLSAFRSVLEHSSPMLLYGVVSCLQTHTQIFEVIWSFVVLKSLADLVTLDCALCKCANKDLQNAFQCATKV